jgi:hypothetical protein
LQNLALFESRADASKYFLAAPQGGKVSFANILEENQDIYMNQEIFYITPINEGFYGEMSIVQDNIGSITAGQQVLIKLKAYPFEEYGMIKGKIGYITDVPNKEGIFMAKVYFQLNKPANDHKIIRLRQGMIADAEIITKDATIFARLIGGFKIP